jgi:Cyanobacterial TRADD-N associated 2-Transmembrane domain
LYVRSANTVTQPVALRRNNQIYSQILMLMEKEMTVTGDQLPDEPSQRDKLDKLFEEHLDEDHYSSPITFKPYFNVAAEKAAITTIQQSDPTDFQAISASKLTLSNSFYNNALRQSQQSFLWSLIWAGVGAVFIISTVTLVIVLQPTIATSVIIALLGGTGGIGSSAIAYATLQLYKQASEQAAACHIRLDRTSDFILANSACEGLSDPEKQQMRYEIIRNLFE